MAYNETLRKELMSRFRDSTQLERAYDKAVRDLNLHELGSEEYAKRLEVVIKLHKMVLEEKSSYLSKDTMATIGANLLGIVMIIKHEQFNVIASRALYWIGKPFTRF
jgi:hypothetical protein